MANQPDLRWIGLIMITIIVADDHNLVRQGICALLEKQENVEVVAQVSDGREAVELIKTHQPDLALIDISMPQLDGIQATQQIVLADLPTKVIILSMHSKPNIVRQVLREGAQGYLLKKSVSEELKLAIRSAMDGHIYLSPEIATKMLGDLQDLDEALENESANTLTAREHEVLQLVAEGNTNKEIAEVLVISERTVEKHRANVMKKLNVSDLPSLINEAMRRDLIFFRTTQLK